MEEELKSFVKVWIKAIGCLCYSYYVAGKIPGGILRFLSLLPIFYLFLILPRDLATVHLGGPTVFSLAWLATFRLLAFSFDQAPLSPPPPKLPLFVAMACLPIEVKLHPRKTPSTATPSNGNKSQSSTTKSTSFMPRPALFAMKAALVPTLFHTYKYRQYMHPSLIIVIYSLHTYLEAELALAIFAIPARFLLGTDIHPQFNEPYLATSLQDFWGRRWNLVVTRTLRPTVYHPIRRWLGGLIGPEWAPLPAVFATFVVSGLVHEIIYFYFTHVSPTWEVTCFFVLHGICVAVEVVVKKAAVAQGWWLPPLVSGPLTIAFLVVTGGWLFYPQLIRYGVIDEVITEYFATENFIWDRVTNVLS